MRVAKVAGYDPVVVTPTRSARRIKTIAGGG
jgi:hypothetical protein